MPLNKPKSKPSRGKRLGLNRERIVQAAIEYADKNGTDQLSMRQLANSLQCGVMSLYNHVADKDDLLEGMVDAVAAEIELPTRKATHKIWATDLRACVISAYKVMLKHRWAAKIWGRGTGPAKNNYHETILRILREAGFSEELACRGFHALTMHVVGFALQVLELMEIPFNRKKEFRVFGEKVLSELPADQYPYLREHVHFHLDGKDQRNDFKYMLDLILEGLRRDKADD